MSRRDFLRQARVGAIGLPAMLATPESDVALARAAAVNVQHDIARFEKRVDLLRQSLDIPGMSIAVVREQQIILARGFGIVDIAKGIAATEHTPYPIASLTKTFAAAVIMRLVDAGKIDLDGVMSAYDPGYAQWCAGLKERNLSAAQNYNCESERITVRHHLSHTAQGKPGTVFDYNSLLFARLSAVVEAVTGKRFHRVIEEDILDPLGMNETAVGAGDRRKADVIARMAKPYKLDEGGTLVKPANFARPLEFMTAASGMISSVTDLAKYDIAIDRGLVYSPQAKQQIWAAATSPTGQKFPYGLGWFVTEFPPGKPALFWHYGWSDAFSSLLFKVPDRRLSLIILACTGRASSVFYLGDGDPLRSAFVTAFLDSFRRAS